MIKTELIESNDIKTVTDYLKNGRIVAFPTDTVFGLGCIYDDEEAIRRVKEAKGRDEKKPLPMMCSSLEMIEKVAYVSDDVRRIIERFTPGALTIIFKKRECISDYVTNGLDTIGIRVPDDETILKMINMLGKPMLVTSANISGTPSLKRYEDVIRELDGRVDAIVRKDAMSDTASTIIDATGDDFKVLREGKISIEDIKEYLDKE